MYTLRPYQEEAIETVIRAMCSDRYVLLQAATGSGKTILFSELIRRFLKDYRMRIAVLAHRRELITQAADKLRKVWPDAPIGLACASVTNDVDTDAPVVIGSIQTLSRRLGKTGSFDLVIIDEAHRLPPRNQKSQYRTFLTRTEEHYPGLRVLGVTATPYRLGVGYIYGNLCKPGAENWFPDLHYKVGIQALQDQGYLCGIRAKEAENIEAELERIRTSGGDYNMLDLSRVMSREIHVGSAVKAYRQYGEDRRHVVVFCVTIAHAEKIREAFEGEGYPTGCVHSEMSLEERDQVLSDYAEGKIRILANVGVLQEGWDSPQTDCILLCRPTKSSALYVQQLGRALRIHPGKEDMLILDLSGNIYRHGNPDSPNVFIPGNGNTAPRVTTKTCPNCLEMVPVSSRECHVCRYRWSEPEVEERNDDIKLTEVRWENPKSCLLRLYGVEPSSHVSRVGNRMLRLSLTCFNGGVIPIKVNHYLDLEGEGSLYGQKKARTFWRKMGGIDPPPHSIEDALMRFEELTFPAEIKVQEDGRYLKWRV